ncbi:MAG: hypothetical protein NVS4B4_20460 [Bradyrhizobium sp.]
MKTQVSSDTTAATPPVLDIAGPRATIRLNRPKHLNRLQADDLDALMTLFDRIEADPAIRVMVLTGTGRAFSAGYDLGSIAERAAGMNISPLSMPMRKSQASARSVAPP